MDHLKWFTPTEPIITSDGKEIETFSFNYEEDAAVLSAWAKHFREHYCLDSKIDELKPKGVSRKDFLEQIVFPDSSKGYGPLVRSGDFTEILISDYLEYRLHYWVPRTRYDGKASRNESTKGTDVLGFFYKKKSSTSLADTVFVIEAKGQLSSTGLKNKLQEAIDGSGKDTIRLATSLHAIKRRLIEKGEKNNAEKVARFQNKAELDFTIKYGAFAVFNSSLNCRSIVGQSTYINHPDPSNLVLIVIEGKDLMTLVHSLYARAANEAG